MEDEIEAHEKQNADFNLMEEAFIQNRRTMQKYIGSILYSKENNARNCRQRLDILMLIMRKHRNINAL